MEVSDNHPIETVRTQPFSNDWPSLTIEGEATRCKSPRSRSRVYSTHILDDKRKERSEKWTGPFNTSLFIWIVCHQHDREAIHPTSAKRDGSRPIFTYHSCATYSRFSCPSNHRGPRIEETIPGGLASIGHDPGNLTKAVIQGLDRKSVV